jgi:beta-ureidopropionase / N-carbamoyl-L-amino-acid hydrolase
MVTIDTDRFEKTFRQYSEIGQTDKGGLHRLTLSSEDKEVRDLFVSNLEELGLEIRIDELGNIFGRREGTDPDAEPVLIGSHLDSQPYGGRFDGQLGVLTALETLRTFDDEGSKHRRPIEIVNWTNEEGSRFKPALMGSGAFIGEFDVDDVLARTDADGTTVEEALEKIGYRGSELCEPREDYHAFLELHIEQGPKMAEEGFAVGVVEGVYGMAWLEATIYGESDHAGPSPMHLRKDALVTASDIVGAVRRLSNRLASDVVTTVGEFEVAPGSINVIPSEVRFTVDVRSYDDAIVNELVSHVEREVENACEREGTGYDLEEIWRIPHTEFSPMVVETALEAAREMNASYRTIISGAGHDASYLNDLTETAMLFVPSVGGKTHNEAEHTDWADVVEGAKVYAETTRRLAN